MKLPVVLIRASCENVILPIVQLFWLALITRPLLLLLLVVTPLTALIIVIIITALIET
jgi:hypothetical protein